MRPSIVVFAYSEPGYKGLQALIEAKANILAVYTHQDDPEEEIWFPSVYELAKANHIPVYRPAKITEEIAEEILAMQPQLIFSIYFRRLIPDKILQAAPLGAYNLHGALLPKYRGQTCINWAVVNGEKITGATLHQMTDKADEGDIVAQQAFEIPVDAKAIEVFHKVSEVTKEIITNSLPSLEAGTAILTPQNHAEATHYGRRRPKDGLIPWDKDATTIFNLIRGVTHPFPGAFTFVDGKKLFIWWGEVMANDEQGEKTIPGTIIATNPLVIKAGKGALKVTDWESDTLRDKDLTVGTLCVSDINLL